MSLDKVQFVVDLTALFVDLSTGATPASKAQEWADLIDAYVKSAVVEATIAQGTYVVSAVIPAGAIAVGGTGSAPNIEVDIEVTMNASPTQVNGDPDAAGGTNTEGGLT